MAWWLSVYTNAACPIIHHHQSTRTQHGESYCTVLFTKTMDFLWNLQGNEPVSMESLLEVCNSSVWMVTQSGVKILFCSHFLSNKFCVQRACSFGRFDCHKMQTKWDTEYQLWAFKMILSRRLYSKSRRHGLHGRWARAFMLGGSGGGNFAKIGFKWLIFRHSDNFKRDFYGLNIHWKRLPQTPHPNILLSDTRETLIWLSSLGGMMTFCVH